MKWPFEPRVGENAFPRHGADRWFASRVKNLRLVNRLDPVWGAIALAVVFAIVLLIGIGGLLYPEQERTSLVKDRRILESFTDPNGCFVNAAPNAEGELMVSLSRFSKCQTGTASGGVTRYNPVWRTFSEEALPFAGDAGNSRSASIGNVAGTVWIRGDLDGLSRWTGSRWAVWSSQTALTVKGRFASSKDITSAAVSPNGTKTLFASRAGQFSVYDVKTARWDDLGTLPGSGGVKNLKWSERGIWIVRTTGLWFARFNLSTGLGQAQHISKKEVVNLSITDSGEAVTLFSEPCLKQKVSTPVSEGGCQSIVRFTADAKLSYRLLDTSTAPVSLTSQGVRFVAQFGRELVLAGIDGVWRYDIVTRSWTHPEAREVTVLETGLNNSIAYGGIGWVAMQALSMDMPQTKNQQHRTRKILFVTFDSNNQPLFTDDQGTLTRLGIDGALITLFEVTAPSASKSIFVASNATHDFFAGPSGQTVLERRNRRYVSASQNPALSGIANARLYAQLGDVGLGFVSAKEGEGNKLVAFDISNPFLAVTQAINEPSGVTLESESRAVFTKDEGRLFAGEINLRQNSGIGQSDLMFSSQPRSGPNADDLSDVSRIDNTLVLSGDWGISTYEPSQHTWNTVSTIAAQTVTRDGNGSILSAGGDGALRRFSGSRNNWSPLFLVPNNAFLFSSESDILDTLISPTKQIVFLAKAEDASVLQVYDPERRRIIYTSRIAPSGVLDGEILSFNSNQDWMVRVGNRAYVTGATLPLAPASKGVVSGWIESAGIFVTLEQDKETGLKFLHRRQMGTDLSTCLYRGNVIDASAQSEVFMASDSRLLTVTQHGIWVYNLTGRRWNKASVPDSVYQVGMTGNRLWARSTNPRKAGTIYQINPFSTPSFDSCSPELRTLAPTPFENAVVTPDKGTVFRIEGAEQSGAQRVLSREVGKRDKVQLSPSGQPPQSGAPLRTFMHEDSDALWMAYPGALARYHFPSRNWTTFALPRNEKWSQVLMADGEGFEQGKLVVTYINNKRWMRVALPFNAETTVQPSILQQEISNPGPVSGGRLRGELLEILQNSATLFFRFSDRIVTMHKGNHQWSDAWAIPDENAEMAIIGNRFVVYSRQLNRIYFQKGIGKFGFEHKLYQVDIPADLKPMFDAKGLVGWIENGDQVIQCDNAAVCKTIIASVPVVDLQGVNSIQQLGDDFLLSGEDGLGVVVTRDPTRRLRRLVNPNAKLDRRLSLKEARNETLGIFRMSRDGESLYMRGTLNGFWVLNGASPDFLSIMLGATSSGRRGIFNPDEGLYIGPKKELVSNAGFRGPIPSAIKEQELVALGRLGEGYWLQTTEGLAVYSASCFIPEDKQNQAEEKKTSTTTGVLVAEDESELEGPTPENACDTREFSAPDGLPIAYIDGLAGEGMRATLQDGSILVYAGAWQLAHPAFELPSVSLEVFHEATTFARQDGQRSFIEPFSVDENPETGLITITRPGVTKTPQRFGFSRFPSGTMEPMDIGWLRFDPKRKALTMGRGAHQVVLPLKETISSTRTFIPLEWSAPAPQTDGTVIVAVENGQLQMRSVSDLTPAAGINFVKRIGIIPSDAVPDKGGHWQHDTFLAFNPEDRLTTPAMTLRNGDFSVAQDRRNTSVRFRHAENRILTSAGFAWDSFNDIGLGPDNQVVLRTGIGMLSMTNPRAAVYEDPVVWSADTLNPIEAATDKSRSVTMFEWLRDTKKNIAILSRDQLNSSVFVKRVLSVSTGGGFGQRPGFGFVSELVNSQIPDRLLVSRDPERPQIFGYVGDVVMTPNKDLRFERATALLAAKLTDPEAWRIGPLFARLSGRAQPRYELRLEDSSGQEYGALEADGNFSFDNTLQAKLAPNGTLYLVTKAGLLGSKSASLSLARLELLAGAASRVTFDLEQHLDHLFVRALKNGASLSCERVSVQQKTTCETQAPTSGLIEVSVRHQQSMWAESDADNWRFFTRYPDPSSSAELNVNLVDGRFSSDRFRAVSVCNGFFYVLNNDGAVLKSPSAALWNDSEFVSMQPPKSRLFCKADKPVSPLLAGLWLRQPSAVWLNLSSDADSFSEAQMPASQIAERTFLTEGKEGQIRLLRDTTDSQVGHNFSDNLLVKQSFDRQVPTSVTLHEKLGPSLEIDRPTGFFAAGDGLWAITPDGIVYYGKNRRNRVFFDQSQYARATLPETCDISSTRRIGKEQTELYCSDGSMVLASVSDNSFTLAAPVSKQPEWNATAGLVSLVSNRNGLQTLTFNGQKMSSAIARRGFLFDTVQSVLVGQDGKYNLVSQMGWHAYGPQGISLSVRSGNASVLELTEKYRLKTPALTLATKVVSTPDFNRLCFNTSNTFQVHLVSDESGYRAFIQEKKPCNEHLGRDGLRSFMKSQKDEFYSVLWTNQKGQIDALVNGRFNGDRILHLPNAVYEKTEGNHICAPTALAGVSFWGDIQGPKGRVRTPDCGPPLTPASLDLDDSVFSVQGGDLYRNQ